MTRLSLVLQRPTKHRDESSAHTRSFTTYIANTELRNAAAYRIIAAINSPLPLDRRDERGGVCEEAGTPSCYACNFQKPSTTSPVFPKPSRATEGLLGTQCFRGAEDPIVTQETCLRYVRTTRARGQLKRLSRCCLSWRCVRILTRVRSSLPLGVGRGCWSH